MHRQPFTNDFTVKPTGILHRERDRERERDDDDDDLRFIHLFCIHYNLKYFEILQLKLGKKVQI